MGALTARLASANPHKLEELRAALPGWELSPVGEVEYPEETGTSYEENARAKARFGLVLDGSRTWVLGEDSGIEVEALGGEPGIHSARWAGNRDPVEALLERVGDAGDRRARYVCALVAVSPDGEERVGIGTLEGTVAREPRGDEGFGYDPIFVPDGEERTVAELGDAWKGRHSHRARAAAALREQFDP
ncbi:MAG TPA: non-canonical purine NTP pyrophosphatase [Gaiellaceae bacterium]|nr:non-canonical purine NTP pyrophosphatase [Gaiellaceae bacterium]